MSSEAVLMRELLIRLFISGNPTMASTPAMVTTTISSTSVNPGWPMARIRRLPLSVARAAGLRAVAGEGQRAVSSLVAARDGNRGSAPGRRRAERRCHRHGIERVGAGGGGGAAAAPVVLLDVEPGRSEYVDVLARVEQILLFAVGYAQQDLRRLR